LLNGIKGLELRWPGQIERDQKIIRPGKSKCGHFRESQRVKGVNQALYMLMRIGDLSKRIKRKYHNG
jgi:hypothetical protein